MSFDFDAPIERRGTDSLKWQRYAGRDVIPLWVADTDFASPPAVVAALKARAGHGVFGYPTVAPAAVAAVCEHLERDFAWRIEPEWLVWLPGLVSGIAVTCRAFARDGGGVVTHTPIYPPFRSVPPAMGCTLSEVPLVCDGERWTADWAATEAAVAAARPELFLFCSPHNPCGRVWARGELEEMAELCLRHDLVICSDEIHNQLVLTPERRHLPTALLSDEVAARTVTLMAPSKTYNLAGLGCSFAVIPDASLRRRFKRAMAGIVPGVNLMGLVAAEAAYREGEAWRQALLDYLRRGHDRLRRAVAELPGVSMTPVEATYLAWLDVRELALEDPADHFLCYGLGLSDGRDFGAPGYLRWNFGCTHATLRRALDRLKRAVAAARG